MRKSKGDPVSVTLRADDWRDLVHFVNGDLHNMDEGCPIKAQMRRVCDAILSAVHTQATTKQK